MLKRIVEVPFEDMNDNEVMALIAETDKFMARIMEDLVNILLKKGLIALRDLPDGAREVIDARHKLREILEVRRAWNN